MKVLFTANIPSPYRVDFFNELGKMCDLTVLFEARKAKSRNSAWVAKDAVNFNSVFLKGIQIGEAEAICPEIIKYINLFKYDAIIIGMYSTPTAMLAIEWMKLNKIPFYISSDGGLIKNDSNIKRIIKRHYIASAKGWLSTGKVTSEYLSYYGADSNRIFVYPFSSVKEKEVLKCCIPYDEKKEIRKKLDIEENKVVLSVGQFIYRKGYDVLLEATRQIDKSIGFYIVGGDVTDEYRILKEKYQLDNVHFVKFMPKEKLAEYYMAADIFVLPTREDIWGLVVNEAMSYGLPVVTTDKCCAGLEMIQDGINGKIVKAESVQELRDAILVSLNRLTMPKKVLDTASQYTIEKMALAHIDFLKKMKEK